MKIHLIVLLCASLVLFSATGCFLVSSKENSVVLEPIHEIFSSLYSGDFERFEAQWVGKAKKDWGGRNSFVELRGEFEKYALSAVYSEDWDVQAVGFVHTSERFEEREYRVLGSLVLDREDVPRFQVEIESIVLCRKFVIELRDSSDSRTPLESLVDRYVDGQYSGKTSCWVSDFRYRIF